MTPDPDRKETRRLEARPGSKQFGRYRILRELGRGGMGVVYLAEDETLDRQVALKVLRADVLVEEEARLRFDREIAVTARLSHPNIVRLYDTGRGPDSAYFTMEYVEGRSLDDRVKDGRLEPAEALRLLLPLCQAVAHAHEQGVLHRDIKPANILLDAQGNPRLTDFGLAGLTDPGQRSGRLTESQSTLGTPNYMPPEQAEGNTRTLDQRADVYSLGAVLYELLTGRPPFDEGHLILTLQAVIWGKLDPPRKHEPSIHPEIETICLKALERRREQRYPSADALAADIEAFLAGRPITARPPGRARRLLKWLRRHPAVQAAGAVLLLALTGFAYLLLRPGALDVTATGAGAQIEIDGRTHSLVQARSVRLWPPGRYRWRVTRPGFQPAEGAVTITPGASVPLEPRLDPEVGRLSVSSPVAEVPIRLKHLSSGRVVTGMSPLRELPLSIGPYELLAQKENYTPFRIRLQIDRGAHVQRRLSLSPLIRKEITLPERIVGRPLIFDWGADGFLDVAVETERGIYLIQGDTLEARRLIRLPARYRSDFVAPMIAAACWSDPVRPSLFFTVTLASRKPNRPYWIGLAELRPDSTVRVVDAQFVEQRPGTALVCTGRRKSGAPIIAWATDLTGLRIVQRLAAPRVVLQQPLAVGGLILEDLTGDGETELIAVLIAGRALVLDLQGRVKRRHAFPSDTRFPYVGRARNGWLIGGAGPDGRLVIRRLLATGAPLHDRVLSGKGIVVPLASPDGSLLVAYGMEQTTAFNPATGREQHPPLVNEPHNVPVPYGSGSPTPLIVPLQDRIEYRAGERSWRLRASGIDLAWLGLGDLDGDGWSELVAASPNGNRVLIGTPFGRRTPVRLPAGQPTHCRPLQVGDDLVFPYLRRRLRRVSLTGAVLWETDLGGHCTRILPVQWEGRLLAAVILRDPPEVTLVDPLTGRIMARLHSSRFPDLSAVGPSIDGLVLVEGRWLDCRSPRGATRRDLGEEDWTNCRPLGADLILGSATGVVGRYDISGGAWRWKRTLSGPVDAPLAVDSHRIAVAVDRELLILHPDTGRTLYRSELSGPPRALWITRSAGSSILHLALTHQIRCYTARNLALRWSRDVPEGIPHAADAGAGASAIVTRTWIELLSRDGQREWRYPVLDMPVIPPGSMVVGGKRYIQLQYENHADITLIPMEPGRHPLWNPVLTRQAARADAAGREVLRASDYARTDHVGAATPPAGLSRAEMHWRRGRAGRALQMGRKLWEDGTRAEPHWLPLCLIDHNASEAALRVLRGWISANAGYPLRRLLGEGKTWSDPRVQKLLLRAAQEENSTALVAALQRASTGSLLAEQLGLSLFEFESRLRLAKLRNAPEHVAGWLESFCSRGK